MEMRRISIRKKVIWLTAAFFAAAPARPLRAQDFSEWNQVSGIKRVEFRWRQNDAKGCDVEYRNLNEADHKKYKSRIVFQIDGDEHEKPYTIVSFADPAPHMDQVPVCTQVTDVSVTRF